MTKVLLTGATGYIASHTWLALWAAGFDVVGVDNLSNSSIKVLDKMAHIGQKTPEFYQGDVSDAAFLDGIFAHHRIAAVIHFAAHKAVGESVAQPLKYYQNNLGSLLQLLASMQKHDISALIFSSSATVYGQPESVPIQESAKRSATNPYGQTKLMAEYILEDVTHANTALHVACLRYFNPVGAHHSGLMGEDPRGIPNNLMPYITKVVAGSLPHLNVFGGDYPTVDGTGVRDYIHVLDLADGHVRACEYLLNQQKSVTVNLGTGQGYSVLQVIKTFEEVNQITIPYQIQARRAGDVASCYADVSRAEQLLGWRAKRSLADMCQSSWHWQKNNPQGYDDNNQSKVINAIIQPKPTMV